MMNQQLEVDEKEQVRFLVSKFQRKGFDGLTLEEVASAMVIPDFSKQFNSMTGQDWISKYEVKGLERLSKAKFDIHWMTRKDGDPHTPLFFNAAKGDINKLRLYLKEQRDPALKFAVDQHKRSPMHIAAMEGRTGTLELLLMHGFNPNARDRVLRTPLHLAALYGWDACGDTLLRTGGDILARDSLGRSAVHFAACGPSAVLLQLLLASRPELANDLDHRRRSPIHYCVWNGAANQVDLMRTLLDCNSNPNALDDDLKTPLHHCAEGGRTRAIPILLQRGALDSMAIRDRQGLLPLDLSANDRTREILVVYSAAPLNHRPEDMQWMDKAIQGEKRSNVPVDKQVVVPDELPVVRQTASPNRKNKRPWLESTKIESQKIESQKIEQQKINTLTKMNEPANENWGPSTINEWIRQKFFVMLKKVQESGIVANHHLKKPYVYTGSWMEGINSMDELYESLKDITPGEVCMRVFNVLCPYDRPLPQRTGAEEIVDGFYGEQWYDSSSFTSAKRGEEMERFKRQLQLQYVNRISELEVALRVGEESITNSDTQLTTLKVQYELTKKQVNENEKKSSSTIDSLTQQLKSKDGVVVGYKADAVKSQKRIQELQIELEQWKDTPQGPSEEDIQQYLDQIQELKVKANESAERERQLRLKAGQLFIKCINDEQENSKQQLEVAIKKTQILNEGKQKESIERQVKAEILGQQAVGGLENMQDDDAIIVLFKALKGNPPPMRQRMRNADGDADEKLTQQEFCDFLKALKIGATDQQSLCRIAGFLNGRKLLGIEEWVQVLQDRPKQREMWEQKLFARLLDAMKSRNITLERCFELLDVDSSGSLTPSELREGLRQLKIVLNQKDLNNMFCIFDADKSGHISLPEMKETLDNYEKLRQVGNNQEDFVEVIQDSLEVSDEFEYIACSDEFGSQDPPDVLDWVMQEKDTETLSGIIVVQIPKAEGLLGQDSLKSISIRVILRGAVKEGLKGFIVFDKSIFQQVIKLELRGALRENLSEHMVVQIFSGQGLIDEDHFLGDMRIRWKQSLDSEGIFSINTRQTMGNRSFLKEQQKMKKVSGSAWIQIKYIKQDSFQVAITQQPQFNTTIVEEGILEVTLVQCLLSQENRVQQSQFYCDIEFIDVNDQLLGKRTANENIYWDKKFLQKLKCMTNEQVQSIRMRVYSKTKKNILQDITKEIGTIFIEWNECIQYPGEYLSKKSFLLDQQQKLYAKVRYIPQSMMQNIVGFKDGVSEKEQKKQMTLEDMQEGTLKVLFVRAHNLPADDGDTSDPYVLLTIDSFGKELKLQSKTIKKTINPQWRDLQSLTCLLPKDGPFPPLTISVYDEDVLGDDILGTCMVDLAPALHTPCTWAVNDLFQLKLTNKPKNPEDPPANVYLQCYWVPKGQRDPNLKAKDKEDIAGGDSDPNMIDGSLIVKLVHARELSVEKGTTPDPYCTLSFPGGSELKSDTISSSTNPLWNQTFTQNLKIPRPSEVGLIPPIKLFVKDSNILSDSVIGYIDVSWGECLSVPGDWGVNQVFKLSGTSESKGQLGSLGFVYLQIKFLERGMIDDASQAPVVENLLDMLSNKQGIWSGTLRVFLVHCRELVRSDGSDENSDPYVIFKVPGGKKLETKVRQNTLNPSWKTIYLMQLSMPKDTVQPLRIEVYDDDLISDELIGYGSVDLTRCFQNPQKWALNEVINLSGDLKMQSKYKTQQFGKVYLQVMFCLQGIDCQDPPLQLTEDIDAILRENAQENKKPMKGQLMINIPLAMGLKAADQSTSSSDPYCKIELPDGHSIETKQVEKCLDPIWNFSYTWNCSIIKEQYKAIRVTVFDSDALAKDDTLGFFDVEWMECFTNPTSWEVNRLVQLQGEKDMGQDLGKVYIQMKFCLDGQERTPEGIRPPDTIPELKDQFGRVLGSVALSIISASQLYNTDLMGKTDAFVEAYLTTEPSKKMKTTIVNDNLNPTFDFNGSLFIDLLRCQVKMCRVRLDVRDDDGLGEDYIGSIEIDLIDILEQNAQSKMMGDYPLRNVDKKGTPNLGSVRVQLAWQPGPYNEGVLGLRQPLPTYDGSLIVRYPSGRMLPKGDPYVKFFLTNSPETITTFKDKYIKSSINPDFNYSYTTPLIGITEAAIRTLRLTTTVMNYNFLMDTIFGGITVSLTDILKKPNTWINQYQQLFDGDGVKMQSYLYVQACFQTDKAIEAVLPPVINFNNWMNEGLPPTTSGKLVFTYIGLSKIKNSDITGASDPFVEIKVSRGSTDTLKTTTQDDKVECFWQTPGLMVLNGLLNEDLGTLKMFITAWDYDYDGNDLIGKGEWDLSQNVIKNGSWINQRIPLFDDKGFPDKTEIYIQAQWFQDGLPIPSDSPQPINLYEEIKQKQIEEQQSRKDQELAQAAIPKSPGVLRVFIDEARSLKKEDTFNQSDPFVEVKVSKGDKNTLKTKTIDDSANPVFNYSGEFLMNLQAHEYQDIRVMFTIYDYDVDANDFLGFVEVNVDALFKNPGSWVNSIVAFKDEHGVDGKNGQVYLLLQWVPDANKQSISLSRPVNLQFDGAIQQLSIKAPTIIQGNMQVNLIKVLGMPAGKKAQAKLLLMGTENKTNLVQNEVNWNFSTLVSVKFNPSDPKQVAQILLLDETAAQVASHELDVGAIFRTPGTWINQYFAFKISNLIPNQQQIYVQMQWRPNGVQLDTSDPKLVPDPVLNTQSVQNAPAPTNFRGTIKVAILKAEKILLLEDGKTSNTKCTMEYEGEQSTVKVKGVAPVWNSIMKGVISKALKIEDVKPIYIKLEHDPGMLSTSKFMGDAIIKDLGLIFQRPGEWAIKQDFLLGDSRNQSKLTVSGYVSVQIGFIPDKSKDQLQSI